MGRSPCCSKGQGLNKGAWTALEDKTLTQYIALHGQGKWRNIPKLAGLKRCGKSCRLRWLNYLRPDIKRGNITPDEEDLIVRLHKLLGNRWSLIAGRLPGRTDNEVKNYWNTVLSKKAKSPELDDHQSNVHCFKRKTVTRQSNVEDDKQQNDTKYDKSSSEGHDDLGIDFNQLIGDIDLTEFLNSDYSELDSDAQLNLDAGFGSLDLFLQESADKGWMN